MRLILVTFCIFSCWGCSTLQADDPSKTLAQHFPSPYSEFQAVEGSVSPNGKFAVILRDALNDAPSSKNFLITLAPFRILSELPTDAGRIEQDREGSLSVNWAEDSSAAVIVLEGKFGPEKLYAVNLSANKAAKITDILALLRKIVLPDFKKSGADAFNDNFDFFIDDDHGWAFNKSNQISIDCEFTNDPRLSAEKNWTGRLTGIWDARSGKLINPQFVRSSK